MSHTATAAPPKRRTPKLTLTRPQMAKGHRDLAQLPTLLGPISPEVMALLARLLEGPDARRVATFLGDPR